MNRVAISLTLGLLLLFVLLAIFIPADTMVGLLSAGIFCATAIGVARWGPAAWRVYFPRPGIDVPAKETRYGVLGLVMWLLSEGGKRIYSVTVITLERPAWIYDLYISAFLNALTLAGLVLVIMATTWPGERPARVPPTLMAILTFLAVLVSYALPAAIKGTVWWAQGLLRIAFG